MSSHTFIAVDLNPESGHITSGTLEDGILTGKEIHHFQNRILKTKGSCYWDLPLIWAEVIHGLMMISDPAESIAVTSWGADYGLLDAQGEMIGLPYTFRDARTLGKMEEVFRHIPADIIYGYTGKQSQPVNTLFQLYAHKKQKKEDFDKARMLLFIPDILNYYFTGKIQTELTIASTSQMLHRETNTWCMPLVDLVWLPDDVSHKNTPLKVKREARNHMPQEINSGNIIGLLKTEHATKTGLGEIPVMAVGSHNFAAAVAAIPAEGEDWSFIKLDYKAHMGVETAGSIINEAALENDFTNEHGVEGTNLFYKTLMGTALLEDCRKVWSVREPLTMDALIEMSLQAEPLFAFIDPDHFSFFGQTEMPEAVRGFCNRTGQNIPQSDAQIVRIILDSLAMKYRMVLDQMRKAAHKTLNRIHVIGTGSRIDLLNQFIANSCGLQVVAGPEDTIPMGNILGQARALGYLDSLETLRSVVVHSFPTRIYHPEHANEWQKAHTRFLAIIR